MRNKRSAFTLIEVVVVMTILLILVTLGIWAGGMLRQDAQTVASGDILATVQGMQQLSDMNGLTQRDSEPVPRLIELQTDLAGAGYANFNLNPPTAGTQLNFYIDANGATHWTNSAQ